MPEPPADTIRRAAKALQTDADTRTRGDRSWMRRVADSWDLTARAMDETPHVRESELQDDRGDWHPVVVSGRGERHHDWTATLAAARTYLDETPPE